MIRSALLFVVCTASPAFCGEVTVVEDAELAAAVESLVTATQAKSIIPGISIAVARGDELILARGYGLADVENDVKVTPDTVFRIGSVTKQFTAAAILRLVEQGKLGLDDEITKHVSGFDPQGHKVTLRHLLTHTSGVKNYTELDEVMKQAALETAPPDLLEQFVHQPFDFQPGARFHYSNSGYILLGMAIESAAGQPYEAVLREFFFEPLGLEHTYAGEDVFIVKGRAQGYRNINGKLGNDEPISMTVPYAAGNLMSTATDLVKWNRELIGGGVVNGSNYQAMTTSGVLTDGNETGYCFGLGRGRYAGRAVISHGGGIHGFTSQLAYYPDDDVTIAVLFNSDNGDPAGIERAIARIVLDVESWPPPARPLSAADAKRFVGDWAGAGVRAHLTAKVFLDGEKLKAQIPNQPAVDLVYQGGGHFVSATDMDVELLFQPESGAARSVNWFQQGQGQVLARKG